MQKGEKEYPGDLIGAQKRLNTGEERRNKLCE